MSDDETPVTIDPLPERAAHLARLVASLNDNVSESNEAIALSNERIAKSNERIAKLGESTRRKIRWLWAALAVGLVALAGIGFAIARSNGAARDAKHAAKVAAEQAAANLDTLRVTCEATNDSRAKTVAVWETFMRIAAPTPTPDQQVKIDQLLTFVRDTYKPRDCAALTTTP